MSIRAYAKHRKVHHSAVQEAIKSGRITPLQDGTIDPKKSDKEWEINTKHSMARGIEQSSRIKNANENIAISDAALKQLKVRREYAQVLDLDFVKITFAVLCGQWKDTMMSLVYKLPPKLQGKNFKEQSDVMKKDFEKAIKELNDEFESRVIEKTNRIISGRTNTNT